MALTLNQVVKNLSNIATAHNQINNFFFGELYDFASSGTTNYPAMAVTLEPAQYQSNVLNLAFNIYVLDLVHKDISNNTEVLSDTLQICLDIISIINDPTVYEWNIDNNFNLTDIQGGMDDEVTGYWFTLRLRIPNPLNDCQVPLRSAVIAVNSVPDLTENYISNDDSYILQSGDGFNLMPD